MPGVFPHQGADAARKYPHRARIFAPVISFLFPNLFDNFARGRISKPLSSGRTAMDKSPRYSFPPSEAAKSRITALSVRTASPVTPQQLDKMARFSAFFIFLHISGNNFCQFV